MNQKIYGRNQKSRGMKNLFETNFDWKIIGEQYRLTDSIYGSPSRQDTERIVEDTAAVEDRW